MVTSQPRLARLRAILRFTPKSISAILGPVLPSPTISGFVMLTDSTRPTWRNAPITSMQCFILEISSVIIPRMVPLSRSFLTIARVSRPTMQGISNSLSTDSREAVLRKLEGVSHSSCKKNAHGCKRMDSKSSRLTP